MKINPSSIVHTTYDHWSFNDVLPEDVISFSISGTFEVIIEEGSINPFTGNKDPDTVLFTNIDIHTSNISERTWEFPTYRGRIHTYRDGLLPTEIFGTDDLCFIDFTPGLCVSLGIFAWYEGIFDNGYLFISGGKDPSWNFDDNGYYYQISATAVTIPLPPVALLFMLGLILLVYTLSNHKQAPSKLFRPSLNPT
jgi:hypothetical protein